MMTMNPSSAFFFLFLYIGIFNVGVLLLVVAVTRSRRPQRRFIRCYCNNNNNINNSKFVRSFGSFIIRFFNLPGREITCLGSSFLASDLSRMGGTRFMSPLLTLFLSFLSCLLACWLDLLDFNFSTFLACVYDNFSVSPKVLIFAPEHFHQIKSLIGFFYINLFFFTYLSICFVLIYFNYTYVRVFYVSSILSFNNYLLLSRWWPIDRIIPSFKIELVSPLLFVFPSTPWLLFYFLLFLPFFLTFLLFCFNLYFYLYTSRRTCGVSHLKLITFYYSILLRFNVAEYNIKEDEDTGNTLFFPLFFLSPYSFCFF